ncbi:MAG: hypothetical protein KDE55_03600 [Novosphingobium sp.]|nr:hypothetical protein [Novosphingobium sp.]
MRPESIRSRPVRMDPVFDDPEAVMALVRSRAPYRTMLDYMGHGVPGESTIGIPWFMDRPDEDIVVGNPTFFDAARKAFGAQIIRPIHVTLNLNAPTALGPPHVDQPAFRGFTDAQAPLWMLMAMSRSRLFHDWLAPVASGLVWFWQGEDGGFEYWADGPEGPPTIAERPMWNTGVMSDNEVMWHRVGGFGPPEQQQQLERELRADATLHWTGTGWDIRQSGGVLMSFMPREIRIALLWKAYVFKDEAHLQSFEDKRYDLSMAQVTAIFLDDLRARGIAASCPAEPVGDTAWRELLEETYRSPFG